MGNFFFEHVPKSPGHKFTFRFKGYEAVFYFGTYSNPIGTVYLDWPGRFKL